jgi:hypothetical protein
MNRLIITSFLVLVALAGSVTAMAYTGGKGECKDPKACCKKETAMAANASCNSEAEAKKECCSKEAAMAPASCDNNAAAASKKECCSKKEAAAESCHNEAEMNSGAAKAKACCKGK